MLFVRNAWNESYYYKCMIIVNHTDYIHYGKVGLIYTINFVPKCWRKHSLHLRAVAGLWKETTTRVSSGKERRSRSAAATISITQMAKTRLPSLTLGPSGCQPIYILCALMVSLVAFFLIQVTALFFYLAVV